MYIHQEETVMQHECNLALAVIVYKACYWRYYALVYSLQTGSPPLLLVHQETWMIQCSPAYAPLNLLGQNTGYWSVASYPGSWWAKGSCKQKAEGKRIGSRRNKGLLSSWTKKQRVRGFCFPVIFLSLPPTVH